jgi:hypothetical protein
MDNPKHLLSDLAPPMSIALSIAFRGIIEPCQRTEVARKTSIIRRIKATVAITSIVMPWRFVNPHFIAAV